MKNTKTNESLVIDFMTKYHITTMPLSNNCGKIILKDSKLGYEAGLKKYIDVKYAIEDAVKRIESSEKDIKYFLNNAGKKFESTMQYEDYDDSQYNHLIEFKIPDPDITDSGVVIKEDNKTVVGDIDQLRKFKSYRNHHHRYCRCIDYYNNEEVEKLLKIGYTFVGLFKPYNDFMEYYRNSTVD